MAIARKCDICGILYEIYTQKIENNEVNAIRFAYRNSYGNIDNRNAIDCCPACLESIKQHIEYLSKKEE